MMKTSVAVVNAFASSPDGGNPAGVVLNGSECNESDFQRIAKEVNLSETAFLLPSVTADYRVRFFTPNGEVDLCGHATIATYWWMLNQGLIEPGLYRQELVAGVLPIEVCPDGMIRMDQSLPRFGEKVSVDLVADIMNVSNNSLFIDALPPQIISTGLSDVIVGIKNRESLHALRPDFAKMRDFSRQTSTIGFHVFTMDTVSPDSAAHCRNFAPLYDIDEEAATGSSSGALACYLWKHGGLPTVRFNSELVFEQGYSMGKPSEIRVRLEIEKDSVGRVQVSGKGQFVRSLNLEFDTI